MTRRPDPSSALLALLDALEAELLAAPAAEVRAALRDTGRARDGAWRVVRRIVGYRRFGGLEAAAMLARLYRSVRLFVNDFQPSFKRADKSCEGAKVEKRYHPPATPYQRLLADPRTSEEVRGRVAAVFATLEPVRLLRQMRAAQQELAYLADRQTPGEAAAVTAPSEVTLEQSLFGLRTAWREGEVRPTSRPKEKAKRGRRRPDPFAAVTVQVREWFQAERPGAYPDGQPRTLQRRLKGWRRDVAHTLVFGAAVAGDGVQADAATGAGA